MNDKDLGGLSLKKLFVFKEICDHGSLEEAAQASLKHTNLEKKEEIREIRKIAANYSKIWKDVEKHYGLKLSAYNSHQISPNDMGKELGTVSAKIFELLEEFSNRCEGSPYEIKIGAGESWLQGLILPNIDRIQEIPVQGRTARITTKCLQNKDTLRALLDHKLDFGILRKRTIVEQLGPETRSGVPHVDHDYIGKSARRRMGYNTDLEPELQQSLTLGTSSYSLIIPKDLVSEDHDLHDKTLFYQLPFVSQANYSFLNQELNNILNDDSNRFNVVLHCQSFPEIATVLKTGSYCAVVNNLTVKDFPEEEYYVVHDHPLLIDIGQTMVLAYNSRLFEFRPMLESYVKKLVDILRF